MYACSLLIFQSKTQVGRGQEAIFVLAIDFCRYWDGFSNSIRNDGLPLLFRIDLSRFAMCVFEEVMKKYDYFFTAQTWLRKKSAAASRLVRCPLAGFLM